MRNNAFVYLSNEELHTLYMQYKEWRSSGYIPDNELGKYRNKYVKQYNTSGLLIMELDLLDAMAERWDKSHFSY